MTRHSEMALKASAQPMNWPESFALSVLAVCAVAAYFVWARWHR